MHGGKKQGSKSGVPSKKGMQLVGGLVTTKSGLPRKGGKRGK